MLTWTLEERRLDLIYNWKISRNESFHKINFFIEVNHEGINGKGEVAPNIRYQETPELIRQQFDIFLKNFTDSPDRLEDFSSLLADFHLCNSLRFAIESAYAHYLCAKNKITIYQLLKIPAPTAVFTSYTIPIIPAGEVKSFIDKHQLKRFKSLKIKINSEGLDLVKEVSRHYDGPIRIDANEAWKDVEALLQFMEQLKMHNIEFVEQPLPHDLVDEYIYLKKTSPYLIIGDESITNKVDFDLLAQQFHGVNMKLMKAGGYLNGIHILQNAKKHGLKTMIGCMVETTLGISSGWHLCGLCDYVDLDGYFVINKEPYGWIKEEDGQLFLNAKK